MPKIIFLFDSGTYCYYSYDGELVWTKNRPGEGARTNRGVIESVIRRGDY